MIPNYFHTIHRVLKKLYGMSTTDTSRLSFFDYQTNEYIGMDTFNFLIHYLSSLGHNDIYISFNEMRHYLSTPSEEDPRIQVPEEYQDYHIAIDFTSFNLHILPITSK